jgi:uncharacterized protein
MLAAYALLLLAVLAGHGALWIALANRCEAIGAPRWALKLAMLGLHACNGLVAVGLCGAIGIAARHASAVGGWIWPVAPAAAYAGLCLAVACIGIPRLVWRHATWRPPAVLRSNHTTTVDVRTRVGADLAGDWTSRLALRLPGNESLTIAIHEKELLLPGLDPAFDGLSIAHLSDLHFTGRIGIEYFRHAAQLVRAMRADLIALTGDIVDTDRCLSWVPDVLGDLTAPLGAFFVLGNHDRRVDTRRLRQLLAENGWTDLAARWQRVSHRGRAILLAGNERPWSREIPPECPVQNGDPLRILLAHTPDQVAWARRRHFDLMLAGHTHGGQIRLPVIGPIVAPSRYGVRYAAGTFHEPPTVMHVSRGLSGLHTLRWNCPPELSKLVLRAGDYYGPDGQ